MPPRIGGDSAFSVIRCTIMTQKQTYLTQEGLEQLQEELALLRNVRRPEVAVRIHKASETGGTVDNAEYDEAKNEQAFVEGRVLTLEAMIKSAVIIPDHATPPKSVQLGSKVTVSTGQGKNQVYVIVGKAEADPSQGRISNESPVGKALLGLKAGATTEVETPSGTVALKVVKLA